jgi:hypothetical protein
LWKEDVIRWLKLPIPIPFHSIWGIDELKASGKERFISSGIVKYVEF